ncbi:MAG: DNA repair protein RecN [Ignavibacteriae bacterium]|nr:DNA repair protein RecN [Ignavibacteriota bacterium]NOG99945.1 DNA repair protein RecN [Ignavibacteriota bacterium]
MLSSLTIKDFALIETIEVEFKKGLNIITGETGAGKSILLGALGLILGERASNEAVRAGAKKSIVEGIFNVTGNKHIEKFLIENEIELDNELIVRREVSLKGNNRCFINDTPVSLSLIKDVGNQLVDLHGQHEHQSLLRPSTHINFLDECGEYQNLLNDFSKIIKELDLKISELKEITGKQQSIKEKVDFYKFQLKEIDEVDPQEDEFVQIENELQIKENSEKLLDVTTKIYSELYEDEDALYDKLTHIEHDLNTLCEIDNNFTEKNKEFNDALAILNDVAEFIRSYKDNIEIDPDALEEMRSRLSSLNLLRKKYGGSIQNVLEYRNKISAEIDLAENFNERIEEYSKVINQIRENAGAAAKKISTARSKLSNQIEKDVEKTLSYLGINEGEFKVNITQNKSKDEKHKFITFEGKRLTYNKFGFDEVEFFISTNSGQQPKPLSKVASGGEISRIMLALKTVLAQKDKLPLLIFDEIDTGVSGRIAQKVGQAIKSLSSHHQIIAITHLPQIAGLAEHHYSVVKNQINGKTISSIRKLNNEERITEVAKLLSGDKVTDSSLESAKELISKA